MAGEYPNLDNPFVQQKGMRPQAPGRDAAGYPIGPSTAPIATAYHAVVDPIKSYAESVSANNAERDAGTVSAAARNAATKAASMSGRTQEDRGAGAVTPPTPVDPSVAAWNAHVAGVSGQLGNQGVGTPAEVAALMNGPQPGWTKQAGLDAINKTGGAPRMLNVGYGSTIVGSGSGERGQANNFVGVGTGAAPAGAAGVFGTPPGGAPSTIDTMQAQLAKLNARQQMYSESGTMRGKLQAVALSRQAQRLSSQIYTEQLARHQMGSLNLETQKANPAITAQLAAQKLANGGDHLGAYKLLSTLMHGANPDAMHVQATPLGAFGYSPNAPDGSGGPVYDMYGKLVGKNPALTDLPTLGRK